MAVRRIVPDIEAQDPSEARAFYGEVLGLNLLMDLGFIATWGHSDQPGTQISFASEGGSGTPVPALSIEVDDLDACLERARKAGFEIVYGPVDEPWGVRRFFARDPFGQIVNILSHKAP